MANVQPQKQDLSKYVTVAGVVLVAFVLILAGKSYFGTGVEEGTGQVTKYEGSLDVTSSPEGANVYYNGDFVGTTPVYLTNLNGGERAKVMITMQGYKPFKLEKYIETGGVTELYAMLTAE